VQLDRRRGVVRDEAGVVDKFGVPPASIPDYLAVVGDSADGFPGVPGWGEKAGSRVFSQYSHLENVPRDWREWHSSIANARRLARALFESWEEALLFRKLATLRLDAPVFEFIDDIRWTGPRDGFAAYCRAMRAPDLFSRAESARSKAMAHTA
jgi:5'-3' exonuclease